MAKVPVRMAGPANVSNAAATKYTCPASTIAVLREVLVTNPSGSDVAFTLSIGSDSAAVRLYDAVVIPANGGRLHEWHQIPLVAAEVIQAFCGTNNALKLTLAGTEQPA